MVNRCGTESRIVNSAMSQQATADPATELRGPTPHRPALDSGSVVQESRGAILWWLVLVIVWVVCALYVLHYLPRGWVPHDEGTLGQSAERVLNGQLPHRDFAAVYTGGLSFLNAVAFRVLGVNLLALRLVLYAVFLLWVPAVYYIATRFVRPVGAGAVVLLAAAWSLPNYSAAMPSWYNLFLATFGVAAVLRYIDVGRGRWLVLAGICGGLSCVVKIVGVYYIGAVLLFVTFREQDISREGEHGPRQRSWGYSLSISAALAAFVMLVVMLIWSRLGARELASFVVPAAVVGAFLMWREWKTLPVAHDVQRFRSLARMVVPFSLGVALPILVFLAPYLRSHSMGALVDGVFIEPMKRLDFAAVRPPSLMKLYPAVLLLPLSGILGTGRARPSWIVRAMVGLALAAAILASDYYARLYILTWDTMRGMVPLVMLCGVWLLARREARLSTPCGQRLVILLAVCGTCALVQYPFAAPIYFFYMAPLAALVGLAVLASWPGLKMLGPATILAFYLLFAVTRIHPGSIYSMGHGFARYNSNERLALARGGINVPAEHAAVYRRLIHLVQGHASGSYTFATPDAPQVYFLSGLANPTRTIYDFFDDPEGREERILDSLEAHRVNVVVVNRAPEFSGPVSPALASALVMLYPNSASTGPFTVRWRK